MMYKINKGHVHIEFDKLQKLKPRSGRRGHTEMFERIECKTDYRNGTFLPRTIREWNALDQNIINSQTTDTFSARLSKLL